MRVALGSSLAKTSLGVRSTLGLAGGKRRPGAYEQVEFALFGPDLGPKSFYGSMWT